MSHDFQDGVLTGGLLSSPAWASWLAQFNDLLTTVTLLVGLLIGVTRLWMLVRRRPRRDQL